MRLAAVLLALALSLQATPAAAQAVSGLVTDARGQALPGASVVVEGTARGTATGPDGRFTLDGLQPGPLVLRASSVGFDEARRSLSLQAGERVEVVFRLAEAALDIGEVVVTARQTLTGGAEGVRDIPGSAHYIGPEELDAYGDTDPMRALRTIPGVTIQEEDGYGLRPNIGLRGVGAERSSGITVMEDGVLIAPAPYAASAAYYFPTLGRMDGIEVRKGSSQIAYGPFTTGGALNLISAPVPGRLQGRLDLLAGENGTRTVHGRIGSGHIETGVAGLQFGFVAEAFLDNADGFKRIGGVPGAASTDDLGELDTGYDRRDLLAKLRLSTAPGTAVFQALELKLSATDELSNETYLGLTEQDFASTPFLRYAGSQRDQMDADHQQVQLRHVAVFPGGFDLTTTLYRNTFGRNWYKLDKADGGSGSVGIASLLAAPDQYADALAVVQGGGDPAGRLYVKANNRAYTAEGVQTVLGVERTLGGLGLSAEAGLRLHRDAMDRYQWLDAYAIQDGQMTLAEAGTPGTDSNRIERARALAAYVQADLTWGALTVSPGLRLETVELERLDYGKADPTRTGADLETRSNAATALIPGLGARLELADGVSVFGGVHRGFAPPSSQPHVRPEESLNLEAGVRVDRAAWGLQAVAFRNDYANLLGSDLAASGGGGTADLYNGGAVDVHGAEVSATANAGALLQGRLPAGWTLPVRLAYTYTRATFESAFESAFEPWGTVAVGDALPYVPPHQLAGSAGVSAGAWSLDLRGSYVAATRTAAGQGPVPAAERLDAHLVLDASAEVRLGARFGATSSLFGRVYNLTDAVYAVARRPAGLRPGLPRTVAIGLRTRF